MQRDRRHGPLRSPDDLDEIPRPAVALAPWGVAGAVVEREVGVHGGLTGDLYVVIDVEEHPFFKRDGQDVHCEIPISFTQAALGAEIEVPTIEGSIKLKIPPGTQNNKKFRLKAKGISSLSARERGEQYVAITVEVPTKLNAEQRQLLERLGQIAGDSYPESTSFLKKMKEWF